MGNLENSQARIGILRDFCRPSVSASIGLMSLGLKPGRAKVPEGPDINPHATPQIYGTVVPRPRAFSVPSSRRQSPLLCRPVKKRTRM